MRAAFTDGVAERLHFIETHSETDLLWSVEEALWVRPVSLVIAAPEKPASLTAGRRLQLATGVDDITGLMLIEEGRTLEGLRRWTSRYGPHAGKGGTDGLIVDDSGIPPLFGGEIELLADLEALAQEGRGLLEKHHSRNQCWSLGSRAPWQRGDPRWRVALSAGLDAGQHAAVRS